MYEKKHEDPLPSLAADFLETALSDPDLVDVDFLSSTLDRSPDPADLVDIITEMISSTHLFS